MLIVTFMLVPSSIPLIWWLLKWDIYYLPFFCRSTGVCLKSQEPSLMPPTTMDTYATTCYENTHMEVKRLFYPSNINSIFVRSSLHGSDDTPLWSQLRVGSAPSPYWQLEQSGRLLPTQFDPPKWCHPPMHIRWDMRYDTDCLEHRNYLLTFNIAKWNKHLKHWACWARLSCSAKIAILWKSWIAHIQVISLRLGHPTRWS